MMAVFDLRGTHGSGKSHIVHALLKKYGSEELRTIGTDELIGHYIPGLGCAVVGPYNKVCGGCDAVKTQEEVVSRVRKFNDLHGKVLLEGSLVGHTYQRYALLADEMGRDSYYLLFLDTPLKVCIKRVMSRRMAKGNVKPLNPKNITKDHHQTQTRVRQRFTETGYNVIPLDWKVATDQVAKLIGGINGK